jgi:phosphatidate phosphatase APP1
MLSTESAQKLLKAQESEHGWLTYRAVSDKHGGAGLLRLLPFTGLSVISDIDDTIKITDIPAGESVVLMNTFFRNFVAVPCMADIYRTFGKEVAFHYVSGAPWQMYSPLSMFLFSKSIGFPRGSFHMKNVRTNPFESETYQDLWILIASGSQESTFAQKIFQINILMKNFPARKFILIGDSGERDPEVFRKINENFPGQVQEIRIRDVVNDKEKKPSRLDGMTLISPNIDLKSLCNEPVNTE